MCSQLKEIMNVLWVKYLQPKAHSPSQSHSSVCGAAGLGPCSQLRSEQHSKGRVWSKQAFRRICCWSVPEISQMAEQTMPCVLPTPLGGCRPRPRVILKPAMDYCCERNWEWDGKKRCLTLTTSSISLQDMAQPGGMRRTWTLSPWQQQGSHSS